MAQQPMVRKALVKLPIIKTACIAPNSQRFSRLLIVSDIAIFVLKRDVKLQLTNSRLLSAGRVGAMSEFVHSFQRY